MICVLSRRTKAQIALEKRLKSSSILLRSAGDEEDKEDDEEEEVVESGHFSQERDFSSVEGWGEEVGEEYSSFLSLMGLEEGEADLELTGFNGGNVVRSGGGADGGKDVKKFRINCYYNHFFKNFPDIFAPLLDLFFGKQQDHHHGGGGYSGVTVDRRQEVSNALVLWFKR